MFRAKTFSGQSEFSKWSNDSMVDHAINIHICWPEVSNIVIFMLQIHICTVKKYVLHRMLQRLVNNDCSKPCPVTCVEGHCYPGNGSCVWGLLYQLDILLLKQKKLSVLDILRFLFCISYVKALHLSLWCLGIYD
jgi:hypothetical protein